MWILTLIQIIPIFKPISKPIPGEEKWKEKWNRGQSVNKPSPPVTYPSRLPKSMENRYDLNPPLSPLHLISERIRCITFIDLPLSTVLTKFGAGINPSRKQIKTWAHIANSFLYIYIRGSINPWSLFSIFLLFFPPLLPSFLVAYV